MMGTIPFLYHKDPKFVSSRPREDRYLILVGILFGLMSYATIQIFAVVIDVPQALYPDAVIPRPWDLIPLSLWLIAGMVIFPYFHTMNPSLFSQSLIISVFPAIIAHLQAAFGSAQLFDHHFLSAYFLMCITYAVPLVGIVLDYINAYQAEVKLNETQSKLDAARQIQRSLLPHVAPEFAGLDISGFSYSSDTVGGDYYDYLIMKDGRLVVVVGDVSGHDLAASLLATQTRAYLRAYAHSFEDLQEVMTRLNEDLVEDTQYRRFITMFVAAVNQDLQSLDYVAAGHQAHLLKANGNRITLDSTHVPIGMIEGRQVEKRTSAGLGAGDIMMNITDGITEALSPQQEQFGLERTLAFIEKNRSLSAKELQEGLLEELKTFCAGERPSDDVTVVLVKMDRFAQTSRFHRPIRSPIGISIWQPNLPVQPPLPS